MEPMGSEAFTLANGVNATRMRFVCVDYSLSPSTSAEPAQSGKSPYSIARWRDLSLAVWAQPREMTNANGQDSKADGAPESRNKESAEAAKALDSMTQSVLPPCSYCA
jgi:hypothetical protein